jgi:hypothetical protein
MTFKRFLEAYNIHPDDFKKYSASLRNKLDDVFKKNGVVVGKTDSKKAADTLIDLFDYGQMIPLANIYLLSIKSEDKNRYNEAKSWFKNVYSEMSKMGKVKMLYFDLIKKSGFDVNYVKDVYGNKIL